MYIESAEDLRNWAVFEGNFCEKAIKELDCEGMNLWQKLYEKYEEESIDLSSFDLSEFIRYHFEILE